jgi:hypothetical protein
MDINSILAFALPISAILVFVIVGVKLIGWVLSSVGFWHVLDARIIPDQTSVVPGSIGHGLAKVADGSLRMAKRARASVRKVLKARSDKAKAAKKAEPARIVYRIMGGDKDGK